MLKPTLQFIALPLLMVILHGCAGSGSSGGAGFVGMGGMGMGMPMGGWGYGYSGSWGHNPQPAAVSDNLDSDPHYPTPDHSSSFQSNLNKDSEDDYYHPAAADRGNGYGLMY
jgi:hypothetical protein